MSEKTKASDRVKKDEEPNLEDQDGAGDEGSPKDEASPAPDAKGAKAPRATGKIRRGDLNKKVAGSGSAEKPVTEGGGKKAKKKKPEKEDRGLELEPISPFKRGISIAVKFAALTAVVVALSMGLLGNLTYQITVQEVDDQINAGGVQAVSSFEKGVDRIFWAQPETVKELVKVIQRPNEVGEPPPAGSPAFKQWEDAKKKFEQDTIDLQAKIWGELKRVSFDGLSTRMKNLVDGSNGQIRSVLLFEKAGGSVHPIAAYPANFGLSGTKSLSKIGSVDVSEGRLSAEGSSVLVRQFDKPITEDGAAEFKPQNAGATPYVSVFVNAQKIEEVKANVWNRIMLVTLMGAVAGVILTAVIAAILSRPIRALEGDIAQVAEGNLEHETMVRSRDEIGGLAHTFNIMTRNVRAAQSHAADRKAIERELAIATEIQTKLLPERIPQIPGLDIHSFYLSAKEVGGDYYDFIVIDQTHLGIIVADVSGKGIPGSMVMTMARSLVRLASVRNVSPGDTFKKVNRILAKDIRRGMFVTSIYMVLNVKTHQLKVASAGHNPLVVFRAETGENELVKPQGIALGFDKGTIFDNHIHEMEIQLKPGDRICAYTDGVNEAMNDQSEEFGDDRFYNLVKQHARLSSKDFVNAIVQELEAHRGQAEQSDDITITTLAVLK